jgi:hypothetical protein
MAIVNQTPPPAAAEELVVEQLREAWRTSALAGVPAALARVRGGEATPGCRPPRRSLPSSCDPAVRKIMAQRNDSTTRV